MKFVHHLVIAACLLLALSLRAAPPGVASEDPEGILELPVPAQFKGSFPEGSVSVDPGLPWWNVFKDPDLDGLETQALAASQDLSGAVARVLEARARTDAIASARYPDVTAPLSATRERITNTGPVEVSRLIGGALFPVAPGSTLPESFSAQQLATTYSDFQVPLEVGYELDVFGRIRHAVGQARLNAGASAADRAAVRLSLSTQVAASYFALRAADSEVAVLKRTANLREDAVAVQQKRVSAGAATDIDLLRARVEEANTEAELADTDQRRNELEDALAALCGESASTFHIAPKSLERAAPPAIPKTLPAQIVVRRPDLIEAQQRVAAAAEGTKAARAEFYPTFSVRADYGLESAQAGQLFEGQSHTWLLTGAVSIPIFDGGRNASNLKLARAQQDEALAAYRQAALTAFRDVEDALSDLRQRAAQADARDRAAADARKVFDASQRSYNEGGMSYFEVIDAERVLLDAELSSVRTLADRYRATVSLVRATGGGFGTTGSSPE